MASISRDANGTKRVLFTDGDGERRSVRLGKASAKAAESFRLRVEALLAATELHQSPDAELCEWLRELPERMYERLARVGLVEARTQAAVMTLGMLVDRFDSASTVKASTRAAYKQSTGSLLAFLGATTPLDSITPARADEWRKWIGEPKGKTAKTLAPATVSKRVHIAKAIFNRAVRWKLISSSAFGDLRTGSQANPDRAFYVCREATNAILEACPDDQWRGIVALSRSAGLRCPSEIVGLRWGDVNWERGRLMVRSPKTESHAGHAVRMVPIAPELRPILQSLFDAAEVGEEMVIPRLRDPRTNLRSQLERIMARAGITPWPRLFQNLRASCACDWVESFPNHVVAKWLGHSPLIAAQHYLQIRDSHFDAAAGIGSVPLTPKAREQKSGAKCGAPLAQNAAQHPTASDGMDSSKTPYVLSYNGVVRADANTREGATKDESGRNWTRTSDLGYVTAAL